jgi:hypothetical protein
MMTRSNAEHDVFAKTQEVPVPLPRKFKRGLVSGYQPLISSVGVRTLAGFESTFDPILRWYAH